MKNKILIIVLTFLSLSACRKENDFVIHDGVSYPDSKSIVSIPTTFAQKMLMEMYSTVSCATCPDAELKYRNYAAQHPDLLYGVCVHKGDAMNNPQFNYLDSQLIVTAYSSGSFNRLPFNGVSVLHKTTWTSTIVNSCLNKTAKCGLKINSNISANILYADVYSAFNQSMTGDYHFTVYILEDSVTGTGSGYNQSNYYDNISSSPFYQLGNPIIGYNHNYVLRKVVTPNNGIAIPASKIIAGGVFAKSFNIDISGYDARQLYIVAFVNKLGSTALTHEIMNVQRVKAGQNKNWD